MIYGTVLACTVNQAGTVSELKRSEVLPLATSRIVNTYLCNQFNYVFALLISMSHFKSMNFYQSRPKIKLFL